MSFVCKEGDSTYVPMVCKVSSTVTAGSLLTYDRTNKKVILATASLLAEDVAGVAQNTPASGDTLVNVIPIKGQIWEWDCTSNTAATDLCIRHILTDGLTVANTTTDQAVDEVVVLALRNVGAAADKKQQGFILGAHIPGAVA